MIAPTILHALSTNYPAMDEALAWLRRHRLPHRKATEHQVKIGRTISWYPRTGAINLDTRTGSRPHPLRGRRTLEQLLEVMRHDL